MKSKRNMVKMEEFAFFNPQTVLKKGTKAKKVSMNLLIPNRKFISKFEYGIYKGGTKFKNSDTLLARISPCLENGKTAFVDFLEKDEVGYGSTEFLVLRAKPGISDPHFLYYLCISPKFREEAIKTLSGTSGRQRIQTQALKNLKLNLPDIKTQRRIGQILSLIDSKIALNEKINDNLLEQIILLFDDLYQSSNWPSMTIKDIAEKVAMGPFGSNIKVSTFVSDGVPIISGNHLRGYFLEESQFNYITEEHAKQLKNSIVVPRDLIFTHAGNIGQVAMIPDNSNFDHYVLSQRQFYLRCNESKVLPEYLLMYFHSDIGKNQLLSYANQTGVPSIAQPVTNLKKVEFKCPPIQKQLFWKEKIEPLLNKYWINQMENDYLSVLRETLIPCLLSGQLDISNLEF